MQRFKEASDMSAARLTIRDAFGSKLYTAPVAARVGQFAIHRVTGIKRGWNVTHVPTGFSACKLVRQKRAALSFARWLVKRSDELGIDLGCDRIEDMKASSAGWPQLEWEVGERRLLISDYYGTV
jgi:hypothetical protein